MKKIRIIGGGLAGPEAALQAARLGCQVELYEMRPTPLHTPPTRPPTSPNSSAPTRSRANRATPRPGCSSRRCAAPALFSCAWRTHPPSPPATPWPSTASSSPAASPPPSPPSRASASIREEVTALDPDDPTRLTIVATGPLTSDALARRDPAPHRLRPSRLLRLHLAHRRSRHHRHGARLLRRPLGQRHRRLHQLPHGPRGVRPLSRRPAGRRGRRGPRSGRKLEYFEGCLPIEETARRGRDTLRFGPMKPVGLRDPRTGKTALGRRPASPGEPARRQLQPRRLPEPSEIRRAGARPAPDPRPGKCHASCATARSTATPTSTRPRCSTETLQLRAHPSFIIAGQLSGVEGYTESIATGMLAGLYAAALARGSQPTPAPRASANGSSSTTSPTRKVSASSPPTSPSTSFPRWKTTSAAASATRKNATESNASAPSPPGTQWLAD